MSNTLSDLKVEARSLLSEEATDFFRDANFTSWANRAQRALYADAPWVYSTMANRKTIPGCPSYLLAPRMQTPKATYLVNTSGIAYRVTEYPLSVLDQKRQYAARHPSQNLWACSYRQTELGTSVELLYEPSAVMTLTVAAFTEPKKLAADTDVTDNPDWIVPLIAQRMYCEAKKKDEESTQYAQGMAEYGQMLRDVRATRQRKQMDMMNMARVERGFAWGRLPWL